MTTIAGKTVVLTGASRGIGRFIAEALAKKQATIIGISRSPAGLDDFCEQVNALGGKAIAIPFDISNLEQLPVLRRQIEQVAPRVDILINNAGIEIYQAFQDYSFTQMQSILTINLLAAMELTRTFLPSMLNQKDAHIVNIASLAGKKGNPYNSVYSASKAGLVMWSDALRQELAGTKVKISTVCPGYVAGQGMIADTGVPIPSLAGASKPEDVAIAVLRAIERNRAEVIVNQDPVTVATTRMLMALWQIFPRFGDTVYQWLGVAKLNQMRAENQRNIAFKSRETTLNKESKAYIN